MADENAQKIRLQILYGTKTEWSEEAYSQLIPKIGELCVDYETPELKVGNGEETWNTLKSLSGAQYYNSQDASWSNYVCTIPHSSGKDEYKLQIDLPVGMDPGEIAPGVHTHDTLNLNGTSLILYNGREYTGLAFRPYSSPMIADNSLRGSLVFDGTFKFELIDNEKKTTYFLAPNGGSNTIATVDEVLPMPELKFCSLSSYDENTYVLTFKIPKGQVQEGDQIQICTSNLSTRTGSKKRKYRLRAKYADIVPIKQGANADWTYKVYLDDKDLMGCMTYGYSQGTVYRYPVHLRIARFIYKDSKIVNAIYSNVITLNIHKNKNNIYSLR